MPHPIVKTKKDEEYWSRAKKLAADQGHKEDYDYIMAIFQNMSGKKTESTKMRRYKKIFEDTNMCESSPEFCKQKSQKSADGTEYKFSGGTCEVSKCPKGKILNDKTNRCTSMTECANCNK